MGAFDHSTQIQLLLERLGAGEDVRDRLIERSFDRLLILSKRIFSKNSDLRSFLATSDIQNAAAMRLHRSLPEVQLDTVRHFFNLAGKQIHREIVDLVRHYLGTKKKKARFIPLSATSANDGCQLEELLECHSSPEEFLAIREAVEKLPHEEQEVVNCIYYQGLTLQEAAELLTVSSRTVKRRLRQTRDHLRDLLSE